MLQSIIINLDNNSCKKKGGCVNIEVDWVYCVIYLKYHPERSYYYSGVNEFIPVFSLVRLVQSLVFCVTFCLHLFVLIPCL